LSGIDPEHLGDLIAKLAKSTKLGQHLDHAIIWNEWEHIVGKALAPHSRPIAVRDGQLRVEAENNVLMHKLAYRKWDMIGRINRLAKKELVHDIFLVLGDEPEERAD
jgi:predicted nucleic acid-binding Zn ribbon protein